MPYDYTEELEQLEQVRPLVRGILAFIIWMAKGGLKKPAYTHADEFLDQLKTDMEGDHDTN